MIQNVSLELGGRRVVVVGGDSSAARRASALLGQGAVVRVVARTVGPDMRRLYDVHHDAVDLQVREVRAGDLDDAWWVTAPGLPAAERARVAAWADERRVWCDGASAHVDDTLVPADGSSPRRDGTGRVVLVGGGPGADDLITVRGLRELSRADVVVTDRLVPVDLLSALRPDVEVVDVGKTPHHHPVPQDAINGLLVEHARRGQHVVRLKGGDPFVLGRGGEEILACRAAGVPVEVVPGVTSAFAAPAAGRVPVTHRGVSRGVLVISGHDALDVPSLVAWQHTIVVLMGMRRLRELTAGLIRGGKAADTPVAVVQSAWTKDQRQVTDSLAGIADRVDLEGLGNPAVIVIGDVTSVLATHPDQP
ncbi:uroporphyrinogen-III C-methyltransferase [Flexivirga sp. B27]